jgi:hypothetical protein
MTEVKIVSSASPFSTLRTINPAHKRWQFGTVGCVLLETRLLNQWHRPVYLSHYSSTIHKCLPFKGISLRLAIHPNYRPGLQILKGQSFFYAKRYFTVPSAVLF